MWSRWCTWSHYSMWEYVSHSYQLFFFPLAYYLEDVYLSRMCMLYPLCIQTEWESDWFTDVIPYTRTKHLIPLSHACFLGLWRALAAVWAASLMIIIKHIIKSLGKLISLLKLLPYWLFDQLPSAYVQINVHATGGHIILAVSFILIINLKTSQWARWMCQCAYPVPCFGCLKTLLTRLKTVVCVI